MAIRSCELSKGETPPTLNSGPSKKGLRQSAVVLFEWLRDSA